MSKRRANIARPAPRLCWNSSNQFRRPSLSRLSSPLDRNNGAVQRVETQTKLWRRNPMARNSNQQSAAAGTTIPKAATSIAAELDGRGSGASDRRRGTRPQPSAQASSCGRGAARSAIRSATSATRSATGPRQHASSEQRGRVSRWPAAATSGCNAPAQRPARRRPGHPARPARADQHPRRSKSSTRGMSETGAATRRSVL